MSGEDVTILRAASGGWIVYLFDGSISHYMGAYATKEQAETRASELRMAR